MKSLLEYYEANISSLPIEIVYYKEDNSCIMNMPLVIQFNSLQDLLLASNESHSENNGNSDSSESFEFFNENYQSFENIMNAQAQFELQPMMDVAKNEEQKSDNIVNPVIGNENCFEDDLMLLNDIPIEIDFDSFNDIPPISEEFLHDIDNLNCEFNKYELNSNHLEWILHSYT